LIDQASILWKLERDGQAISCLARLLPYGIELDIAHDGAVVLTRAFDSEDEATAWALRKRAAREAEGWRPVSVSQHQGKIS
jgi:hypothetical protein